MEPEKPIQQTPPEPDNLDEDLDEDPDENDPYVQEAQRIHAIIRGLTQAERSALRDLGSPRKVLERLGLPYTLMGVRIVQNTILFRPDVVSREEHLERLAGLFETNRAYFMGDADGDAQNITEALTGIIRRLTKPPS